MQKVSPIGIRPKVSPVVRPRGFTLIEVLVSVAIFAIVMTIALGALLAMSESDRKAQTLKSVVNNLNFSLDTLTRTVRTGTNYHCDALAGTITSPRDCDGQLLPPASSLAFLASNGATTIFYCLGTITPSIACDPAGTVILRSVGGLPLTPITSAEVAITSLQFYVKGAPLGDSIQPKVTMLLSGKVVVNGTQNSLFNLQTSVTQRIYDQ